MSTNNQAAFYLEGLNVGTGWKVVRHIPKNNSISGGYFSESYIVQKGNEKAFLKALNIAAFFQLNPGYDLVDTIQKMTKAFQFERDILQKCKNHRLSNVVTFYESGQVNVQGDFFINDVPFLIFELAESDIRKQIEFSKKIDVLYQLNSIHDVAVALKQLHSKNIGHHDVKPSNIFSFGDGVFKVGDLGRSICDDIDSPHDDLPFSGDRTYAPPEIFYKFYIEDWHQRVFSIDCYLLGSLICYFFIGANMTTLIKGVLNENFGWYKWKGDYDEVLPYLEEAFTKALKRLEDSIIDPTLRKDIVFIVACLCNPDPRERGHPKTISSANPNQFDLERIVTRLAILKERAKYNLIKEKKTDVGTH